MNLNKLGSAVLTFIGYKQTNRQTNRQAKFIYRLLKYMYLCTKRVYNYKLMIILTVHV